MKLVLFELDPETRLVSINKEWISTIKEFKKILTRDRGSRDDSQGRKKLQATREFTFIYHYCDYGSKFVNYSEEDLLKKALINAELPETTDITKDTELLEAIAAYKGMQNAPSLQVLSELKEGIHTSLRVVRKIRAHLEVKLAEADFDNFDLEDRNGKDIKVDPVTRLTNSLTALLNISNEIPKALKTIEEQEAKVKKELADSEGLRGDASKGEREDGSAKRQTSNIFE